MNPEIIVIGGGISGLSAANYLKEAGFNPIVLEAQPKVGGRTSTDRSLGIAFDEGASWIHGPVNNPITLLAKKAGMETFVTEDDNQKVYDIDGLAYPDEKLEQEENALHEILENFKGDKGKSFGEVIYQEYPHLRQDRLWTFMLSAYLEFDEGSDIFKLASMNFQHDKAFKFDGEDVIISNGYDKLAKYLATGLDIHLSTQVKGIDYSEKKVSVHTTSGSYTADKVLITVPLGVLKKGIIKFSPDLPPQTQKAIHSLEMGTVNKFLLIWDEVFWENELQYLGFTPEEKGKFNYFLNVKKFSEIRALMTFAFGDYAYTTEQMTDQEIIDEIMSHLKAIYGDDTPDPTHMLRTRWKQNPYSLGSYSHATVDSGIEAFKIFEEPIDNKLFFAGEHTISEFVATVHGAYLSGIREVKKMIGMV
ncbi:MAG: FAD-dependent oxidoreductase [Bacteroidia bacterium]|nr:FAD-dependent oxidoreductase [Bacteroidia bacterium]